MSEKKRNQSFIVTLILIMLIGTGIFLLYKNIFSGGVPPAPPPVTNPLTGETYSFSMFQAVRVVYTDGSDSWKYPQSRTSLSSLSIKDNDKFVSSLQAYIFFNFQTNKQASSVVFTADAKLSLYSSSKTLLTDFGDWMPISQTIANPQNATDTYVISSTITATDFQNLYTNWAYSYPYGTTYYYVITCKNITAIVTYTDGTSNIFTASGVQATENQLWWQFTYYTSSHTPGFPFQIVNTGIEWVWK